MAFDPDKYLAEEFNPDAYLSEFDPDSYLKEDDESLLEKAIFTKQEEFTPEERERARQVMEERGDPVFGQTVADILAGVAYGASGGLVTRIQGDDAKTERAIQRIREERSPIAKTVGEIAGYISPVGLLGTSCIAL